MPFHKAQEFGKVPKKLAGGPAPDLEDVFDVRTTSPLLLRMYTDVAIEQLEDDVEEEVDIKDDEGSEDVSKDSLIKEAKGKGKGKKAASAPVKEIKPKAKK